MKYIDQAMDRLKSRNLSSEDELSLIERILITESDPNLACILALDLILVGIDTVRTPFGLLETCSLSYIMESMFPCLWVSVVEK